MIGVLRAVRAVRVRDLCEISHLISVREAVKAADLTVHCLEQPGSSFSLSRPVRWDHHGMRHNIRPTCLPHHHHHHHHQLRGYERATLPPLLRHCCGHDHHRENHHHVRWTRHTSKSVLKKNHHHHHHHQNEKHQHLSSLGWKPWRVALVPPKMKRKRTQVAPSIPAQEQERRLSTGARISVICVRGCEISTRRQQKFTR